MCTICVLRDTDTVNSQCFIGYRSCVMSVFYGIQIMCTICVPCDTDTMNSQCFMGYRSCVLSVFYVIQIQ